MATGLLYAPGREHTLTGHPEHAGRLAAVWGRLESAGILDQLTPLSPQPATPVQVGRVHAAEHLELVRWASAQGHGMIGADTYVTPATQNAALLAAGGACRAVEAVLNGQVRNALALVRPPGHHAGWNTIEGFCLYNNVAMAARQAQATQRLRRVLIVDFDVHHGNGTQQIFEWDDTVLFISLHMFAPYFYPGTGQLDEIGLGEGRGYTLNVPFPPGVGDRGYAQAFEQTLRPKITAFDPDLILVSAGFDAHWRDPLAEARLSLRGYAHLSRTLISWAEEMCQGRIIFVLEGGYLLEALSHGILNTAYALLGQDQILDPLGPCPYPERDVAPLLVKFRQRHLLG